MKVLNILKITFLLLGTVIGAGFTSGKEVFLFFGSFYVRTCINIVLCGVAFFLAALMFLSCKKKCNFFFFQKSKVGAIFDVVMLFFMFISVSALCAAITDAMGIVFSILSLIFCVILVFMGIKSLQNLNFALVPIIIVVLGVVCFSSFGLRVDVERIVIKPTTINAFLYVGMNIFLASEVLIDSGEGLTKRERVISAISSSCLFVFVLLFITLGFRFSSITDADSMPILKMASRLGSVFYKVYLFVLWAGIFTTLASIIYSLKAKANKIFGWNNKAVAICMAVAFLFSLFGFERIVNIFYPMEGFVGVIYIVVVFVLVFLCEMGYRKKKKTL